jgi:hypothetical protein
MLECGEYIMCREGSPIVATNDTSQKILTPMPDGQIFFDRTLNFFSDRFDATKNSDSPLEGLLIDIILLATATTQSNAVIVIAMASKQGTTHGEKLLVGFQIKKKE